MRWNYNKKKVILLSIILLLLILSYFGFALYKYLSLKKYEGTIYPVVSAMNTLYANARNGGRNQFQ